MGNLKNGLRRFSVPPEGVVNADLTLNHPDVEPRIASNPDDVTADDAPTEAPSGISITGPRGARKIGLRHQTELAETLPHYPQRPHPVTAQPRRRT